MAAGMMLMGGVAAASGINELPADADLVVHFYNTAGVGAIMLWSAKHQATTLLANAGIKARFVDCLARPEGKCADSTDPRVFILSIVVKVPDRLHGSLGYALPYTELGNQAFLNFPRIDKTAPLNTQHLLGTVIAHELAHLLFRSAAHGSGIMKEKWTALARTALAHL